jgi:predicted O-methyltransferase YrrM
MRLLKSRESQPVTRPTAEATTDLRGLPAFTQAPWQMSYGERTVLEGLLAMISPRLAIEIGRAEGGSLRRIAAHSEAVLSFDIVDPPADIAALPNVTALTGDSHVMLPAELQRIADAGGNVDFVLVDGDHSAEGARKDMVDLLSSGALQTSVIVAHDTLNEEVRQGLCEVDYDAFDVGWVDLDFVPGYVARTPERLGECWGGLGLVVVDRSGSFRGGGANTGSQLISQASLVWPVAKLVREIGDPALPGIEQAVATRGDEVTPLREDLTRARSALDAVQSSASWRLTEPLRALKRRVTSR